MKQLLFAALWIVLIISLVWTFIWILGRTRMNKDAMGFIQQLAYLDACIKYGLIDEHSVKFIREKFNEIEQIPDADPDKIQELKEKFKERYCEFLQEASEY